MKPHFLTLPSLPTIGFGFQVELSLWLTLKSQQPFECKRSTELGISACHKKIILDLPYGRCHMLCGFGNSRAWCMAFSRCSFLRQALVMKCIIVIKLVWAHYLPQNTCFKPQENNEKNSHSGRRPGCAVQYHSVTLTSQRYCTVGDLILTLKIHTLRWFHGDNLYLSTWSHSEVGNFLSGQLNNYSPKWRWIAADIYRAASVSK